MKKLLFSILFCISLLNSQGQGNIPIGTWRVHSPFRFAKSVEYVYNRVYVGTENGLFYYDLVGNTLQSFTKKDGLNEAVITTLKYDQTNKQLLVAYNTGAIDLLSENGITYFTDIKRSSLLGSKSITNITIYNNLAYISCGIGLIVFDLKKKEIKESYTNLSSTGALTPVKMSTVYKDTLFAISSFGMVSAPLKKNRNLMDFKNWKSYTISDSVGTNIAQISSNSEWLFAVGNKDYLYKYKNGKWTRLFSTAKSIDVKKLVSSPGSTLLSFGVFSVFISDSLKLDSLFKSEWANMNDVVFDPDDNKVQYAADFGNGLVKMSNKNPTSHYPSGPYGKNAFRIKYANGKMYLLGGGFYNNFQSFGIYQPVCILDDNDWTYRDLVVRDIVSTVYNPKNGKQYFSMIKSRGTNAGLAVINADNSVEYLNDLSPGSTLIDPVSPGAGYLSITDVNVDNKGLVWLTHASESAQRPILHSIDLQGNWKGYSLISDFNQSFAAQVIIDDNNNKWIKLGARDQQYSGLLVFNEKRANGQQVKSLTVEKGAGNLPDINVRCLEKDTNGEIWVGTAKGVAVFYNPASIFSNQGFDAGRPVYNSRPLLDGQDVLDIKVDGGNRKWIATNDGVWLFTSDGSEVIYNFTAENSPLPSNIVIDIDINNKTGEVFFVTNGGVVSFREGATAPETTYSTVDVFPNPVQPNFSGEVGIRGLTFQSVVKITDIKGDLIYQTTSLGGTATWNLKTTNGQKAKAGVYLIFCISQDGNEQLVSKVAVLD